MNPKTISRMVDRELDIHTVPKYHSWGSGESQSQLELWKRVLLNGRYSGRCSQCQTSVLAARAEKKYPSLSTPLVSYWCSCWCLQLAEPHWKPGYGSLQKSASQRSEHSREDRWGAGDNKAHLVCRVDVRILVDCQVF